MENEQHIREAIQSLLDDLGDGWTLTQLVLVMGLERVHDGRIESTAWYWTPPGQAEWMTTGLFDSAIEIRENSDTDY
mgnify:CR=1 FL=1